MVNFCSRPLFYFSDIFGSFQSTQHGAGAVNGTPAATSTAQPTRPSGRLAKGTHGCRYPSRGVPHRAPVSNEDEAPDEGNEGNVPVRLSAPSCIASERFQDLGSLARGRVQGSMSLQSEADAELLLQTPMNRMIASGERVVVNKRSFHRSRYFW